METIGERLRYARDKKNLKQTQVKARTGIHNKTLSGYENNVSQPDFESLKLLAELYEVSTDWLLGVDEKESDFSLPEGNFERMVRQIEREAGIKIDDNPILLESIRNTLKMYVGLRKDNSKND